MTTAERKQAVHPLCVKYGPVFGYDPVLILAICQQESNWDHTQARLENDFYRGYARPMNMATTTELMFSASYGLMQVMGLSLYQLEYFEDTASRWTGAANKLVTHRVDQYMVLPEDQVLYGCAWLHVKELQVRKISEPVAIKETLERIARWRSSGKMIEPMPVTSELMRKALWRYNGKEIYATEVLAKYTQLSKEKVG